jgi:hypothetical protein
VTAGSDRDDVGRTAGGGMAGEGGQMPAGAQATASKISRGRTAGKKPPA